MASKQSHWFGALQMQLTVEKWKKPFVNMFTSQSNETYEKKKSDKLYNP
jgi:hypothetical protein